MSEITAALVKELREKTDAPMMECKKALTFTGGDMAKAEEILRVYPYRAPEPKAVDLTTLKRWLKLLDQGHDLHVADEIRAIVRAAS